MLVVASETDQIIPIEEQRRFCEANGFKLTVAQGLHSRSGVFPPICQRLICVYVVGEHNDKHAMYGIARDGSLADAVFRLAGRRR